MPEPMSRTASGLAAVAFVVSGLAWSPAGARAQQPADPPVQPPVPQAAAPAAYPGCTVDLAVPETMRCIVSNALTRGLKVPEGDVRAFLPPGAARRYGTGPDLLKDAAAHFKVGEEVLAAKVEKYKHCNCRHAVESALPPPLRVDAQPHPDCTINLELAGTMGDVLWNALRELEAPEDDIRALLDGAGQKYEDGPEVLRVAAARFKLSEDVLAAEAQKLKHINCRHAGGGEYVDPRAIDQLFADAKIAAFARDVTLHVVLHEIGHALIREFDIPVLGNEETVADAFATYYLTTCMPDRAVDALTARVTSLMIEAGDASDQVDWSGEHDHDARRANQIAALAVAADPVKYKPVADVVKMSDGDIEDAVDYGGENRRSWRRVLGPLWMPEGVASAEARVIYDPADMFFQRLCGAPEAGPQGAAARALATEIESALKRFDWHSRVTVRFVDGDGKAGWSRSARTVTVHSGYVRRFIDQGGRGLSRPVSAR